MIKDRIAGLLSESMYARLIPPHLEFVPQLNEVYELELAFLESRILDDTQLIQNAAYFARVGDTLTRHFVMCSGEPVKLPQHSSSRLRAFFQNNQFKTGYGTHGLFPYRGKFHPQMVKGILNAMGLKPGDIVLDPMMGSGTVLIEATLMGIRSAGIDSSPFCRFMTQVKLDALSLPLEPVRDAFRDSQRVFQHFVALARPSRRESHGKPSAAGPPPSRLFDLGEPAGTASSGTGGAWSPGESGDRRAYDFLLLAYLDSAGYAERSQRRPPYEQFRAILERYLFVAEKIQHVLAGTEEELGAALSLEGDARHFPFDDESVDGVLFSPPYSFAIDYLQNDRPHLEFLGVDMEELRERMVGLRGTTLQRKFDLYQEDMAQVLSECARVLRPGRICTIIVGTNENQLSKVLGTPPHLLQGIDQLLVEAAEDRGLKLVRRMRRQITGMANTMRTEFILMLERA